MLWACAHYWWVGWSFAAVQSWTYPKFVVFLAMPALLYSLATTLASPDPSAVGSFGEHFHQVHRRFFALFATYMVVLQLASWTILDVPALHPVRALQLIAFLAFASGAATDSRRYHACVGWVVLLLLLVSTL